MKAILLLMVLCVSTAQAQVLFHLEGTITSFDEKQVTIEIDGVPFKVPRLAFGKTDLRPGKAVNVGASLATMLNVDKRLSKGKVLPPPPEEK